MSPISFRKVAVSLAIFAVVTLASATLTRADTVTFNLNRGSTLPNQQYGTLTLTLVGSSIQVDISLLAGNRIVHTGFDASVAFNYIGTGQISVSGLPANYTLVNSGNPSAIDMDGFGRFEYGVLFGPNGGGAGTDSSLTFTVSRVGGFNSVFDLVQGSTNPPGSFSSPWAVDIICDTCGPATGVIGATVTGTPEPTTMLLLGSGLLGLGASIRKRLRR
ncbi:MAG TPA: PEP-CTERM sorting domain-containing protein [Pyrinomonadaceae bacterium]|nr:PEP-CTERM sorting domain-containing protein [Pyrinomonadaceae bacterium]